MAAAAKLVDDGVHHHFEGLLKAGARVEARAGGRVWSGGAGADAARLAPQSPHTPPPSRCRPAC